MDRKLTALPDCVDRSAIAAAKPEDVLAAVGGFYGITTAEIRSSSRRGKTVTARHMAHYFLSVSPQHFRGIGYTTMRHHSTVIYSRDMVEARARIYKSVMSDLEEIARLIINRAGPVASENQY